jgi:hypothetical protein
MTLLTFVCSADRDVDKFVDMLMCWLTGIAWNVGVG